MTASPEAQVPMNQDNTEIVPVPVGAPHIDQSKYRETHMSDVVDELTVPNAPTQELHQPAHFRENVDGFTDQGSRFTRGQKWMAVGAGVLMLGAGVLLGKASSNSEPSSQSTGSDVPSTSAPAIPGTGEVLGSNEIDYSKVDIATYPHESFVQLPYGVQIDKVSRYFDEAIEGGAVDKYISDATAINGYNLQGGVGTGSINDQPQEIANRVTIQVNTYRHEQNLNLARNLVSGVFKPGTASYEEEMKRLDSDGEPTPSNTTTYESTPVFTQGTFADTNADGTPTRIIVTAEDTTGRVFDMVVQEEKSSIDPSITQVVVVSEIGSKEAGSAYREDLNNWIPAER